MIRLKTEAEIRSIWRSGQIGGSLLRSIPAFTKVGMSTADLDDYARDFLQQHDAIPAFLGYNGYPGAICTSLNEQVVHGIPGGRKLKEGDLLTVDVGTLFDGMISDTALTFVVGAPSPDEDLRRLVDFTRDSLLAGIAAARAGQPLRVISRAIQTTLERGRLGIIQELTGHGVGFAVHEEPSVYNFDPGGRKPLLNNGMVLAVEPMASLGNPRILLDADNWTYFTADHSLSAHFEHTIACWDNEVFILTDPADEVARKRFGS